MSTASLLIMDMPFCSSFVACIFHSDLSVVAQHQTQGMESNQILKISHESLVSSTCRVSLLLYFYHRIIPTKSEIQKNNCVWKILFLHCHKWLRTNMGTKSRVSPEHFPRVRTQKSKPNASLQ